MQKKKLSGNDNAPTAEMKRNPKAFTNQSRMKAKLQRARSAEKEQKRMHGASLIPNECDLKLSEQAAASWHPGFLHDTGTHRATGPLHSTTVAYAWCSTHHAVQLSESLRHCSTLTPSWLTQHSRGTVRAKAPL